MRYFRPHALGWWGGMFAIALGIIGMIWPGEEVQEISYTVALLLGNGDATPGALIALGLGIIGIRDKQERDDAGRN